jgi:hypothetical protein
MVNPAGVETEISDSADREFFTSPPTPAGEI